jgi:hypothetical protein
MRAAWPDQTLAYRAGGHPSRRAKAVLNVLAETALNAATVAMAIELEDRREAAAGVAFRNW